MERTATKDMDESQFWNLVHSGADGRALYNARKKVPLMKIDNKRALEYFWATVDADADAKTPDSREDIERIAQCRQSLLSFWCTEARPDLSTQIAYASLANAIERDHHGSVRFMVRNKCQMAGDGSHHYGCQLYNLLFNYMGSLRTAVFKMYTLSTRVILSQDDIEHVPRGYTNLLHLCVLRRLHSWATSADPTPNPRRISALCERCVDAIDTIFHAPTHGSTKLLSTIVDSAGIWRLIYGWPYKQAMYRRKHRCCYSGK